MLCSLYVHDMFIRILPHVQTKMHAPYQSIEWTTTCLMIIDCIILDNSPIILDTHVLLSSMIS